MSGMLVKLTQWRRGFREREKARHEAYLKGWRAGWLVGWRRGYAAAQLGEPGKERHDGHMHDS
jgi:hypothetical protein